LPRARPEDDAGFGPTAFSDPPTARRSFAAEAAVRVIATILGAVELLWKAVAAIDGPRTETVSTIHSSPFKSLL
jgi:hypothetical protein